MRQEENTVAKNSNKYPTPDEARAEEELQAALKLEEQLSALAGANTYYKEHGICLTLLLRAMQHPLKQQNTDQQQE